MRTVQLDADTQARHKLRNLIQSWLLIGGSLALLAATAWALAGPAGVIWAAIGGAVALAMSLRVSPAMVLRLYNARPITVNDFPEGVYVLRELARRAGLPQPPKLCYVPSRIMNAFAVGEPGESVICVTDGLLRGLNIRQLAGVLGHEISHIRNGDLRVMAIADLVSRMTSVMSMTGVFLLFLNLPLLFAGNAPFPWFGILLLMAAPTLSALMQLALSRAREYDADLDAAGLTGDPEGLALALATLERRQGQMWEMMLPGQRIPDPSILRSHPRTQDRIDRLMSLKPTGQRPIDLPSGGRQAPIRVVPVVRPPRFRASGLWY
jgi:heat shock protein HtpX